MRMILLFLLYYTDKSNNKEVIIKLYHLKPKNKLLTLIFFFLRIDIETPDPLSRVRVCQGYRSSNPYPYPLHPTLQPQGFGQPLTITTWSWFYQFPDGPVLGSGPHRFFEDQFWTSWDWSCKYLHIIIYILYTYELI